MIDDAALTLYPVTNISWAIKIKDELQYGSNCRESFINRKAQSYLPAEEPGGGWNRFYKLSHVETLVRIPGWLTDLPERWKLPQYLMYMKTNVNVTRNRPQSLGRPTFSLSNCI